MTTTTDAMLANTMFILGKIPGGRGKVNQLRKISATSTRIPDRAGSATAVSPTAKVSKSVKDVDFVTVCATGSTTQQTVVPAWK
jgi:hypothetical protein